LIKYYLLIKWLKIYPNEKEKIPIQYMPKAYQKMTSVMKKIDSFYIAMTEALDFNLLMKP